MTASYKVIGSWSEKDKTMLFNVCGGSSGTYSDEMPLAKIQRDTTINDYRPGDSPWIVLENVTLV